MDGGSGRVDEMADLGLGRPMNSIVGLEAMGHDGEAGQSRSPNIGLMMGVRHGRLW